LNIGKVTILNFKVLVIENHWKFKMDEGPLVSVQHRLSAARTPATRARDSCTAARHLTAMLSPERKPRMSVEAILISAPLKLGKAIQPLLHLARCRCPLHSASSSPSAPHL
jgi:hypothetical protein